MTDSEWENQDRLINRAYKSVRRKEERNRFRTSAEAISFGTGGAPCHVVCRAQTSFPTTESAGKFAYRCFSSSHRHWALSISPQFSTLACVASNALASSELDLHSSKKFWAIAMCRFSIMASMVPDRVLTGSQPRSRGKNNSTTKNQSPGKYSVMLNGVCRLSPVSSVV